MKTLAITILLLLPASLPAGEIFVACWNIENLFDTQDDPQVRGDEDYTPSGKMKWTDERLKRKLGNLVKVIGKMNDGKGPDILGLGEVENRKVVEMLVAELASLKHEYKIVHQDSPSDRGIDCAIIYDSAKFQLKGEKALKVEGVTKPTRDIIEAELSITGSGHVLHVFANHWPSRSNPPADRVKAAAALRKRVDEILAKDKAADLLIMGDLNDYPDNDSIAKTLRAGEKLIPTDPTALVDTMWPIFKSGDKGTSYFMDEWTTIDHVIVSPGLLEERGLRWRKDSTQAAIVTKDQLFDLNGKIPPRPNTTYGGEEYHPDGISDHLPVTAVLDDE